MEKPRLSGDVGKRLADCERRIVITGAGGWIGRATLELLHNSLGSRAFSDRVIALGSEDRLLELRNDVRVRQRALQSLTSLGNESTIFLHLAFLTMDRAKWMDEQDYVHANRGLSQLVFDSLDRIGTEGLFVASSGAARRAADPHASPAKRIYGWLKLEDEQAAEEWHGRGENRTATIARIFNLSGPYINKHENYALASFILDALAGAPIQICAPGKVVRGYVAIRELMSVVFALMLDNSGDLVRFDTAGAPLEVQQIAEEVGRVIGSTQIHRPNTDGGANDEYLGDPRTYSELLSKFQIPTVPFAQQVAETASFLSAAEVIERRIVS